MPQRPTPHPQAGQTVVLVSGQFEGQEYWIEDWWERVSGKSWKNCDGNPAALEYAMRSGVEGDPFLSDDVVYGKIGGLGKIIHIRHLPSDEKVAA